MTPGAAVRSAFPSLSRVVADNRPLTYLDSAATSLRPQAVIDRVATVMGLHAANVHRSVHVLGDEATEIYEGARRRTARRRSGAGCGDQQARPLMQRLDARGELRVARAQRNAIENVAESEAHARERLMVDTERREHLPARIPLAVEHEQLQLGSDRYAALEVR